MSSTSASLVYACAAYILPCLTKRSWFGKAETCSTAGRLKKNLCCLGISQAVFSALLAMKVSLSSLDPCKSKVKHLPGLHDYAPWPSHYCWNYHRMIMLLDPLLPDEATIVCGTRRNLILLRKKSLHSSALLPDVLIWAIQFLPSLLET